MSSASVRPTHRSLSHVSFRANRTLSQRRRMTGRETTADKGSFEIPQCSRSPAVLSSASKQGRIEEGWWVSGPPGGGGGLAKIENVARTVTSLPRPKLDNSPGSENEP